MPLRLPSAVPRFLRAFARGSIKLIIVLIAIAIGGRISRTFIETRPVAQQQLTSVAPAIQAVELSEGDTARRQLDAEADAIDAAKGTGATKSVVGMTTEGGEVSGFRVDGVLRRIDARLFGETSQQQETYYLREGKPFLVVSTGYDYTMPMNMPLSRIGGLGVRRYYFIDANGGINTDMHWDEESYRHYVEILAQPGDEVSGSHDGDGHWRIDADD